MKYGLTHTEFPFGLGSLHHYLHLDSAPEKVDGPDDSQFAYGMLGNDRYGDCTFAGFVHALQVICLILGVEPPSPTDAQVVDAYLAFTGGQDTGCVEARVLNAAYRSGLLGHRLVGYAPGRQDLDELWRMVATFGVGYLGIQVPGTMQQQFQLQQAGEGGPLDLTGQATLDNQIVGGHCVVTLAYDQGAEVADILTWCPDEADAPKRTKVTFRWLERYLTEKWALIPAEVAAKGGLDGEGLARLEADLATL